MWYNIFTVIGWQLPFLEKNMNNDELEYCMIKGEAALARAKKISTLNDVYRLNLIEFGVITTPKVNMLSINLRYHLFNAVINYNDFPVENDPYLEHDFGALILVNGKFLNKTSVKDNDAGETYYFKFDYFDENLEYGSEDPTDILKTKRILTIMHSSEN